MKRKINRENNVQATEDMACNSKNSFHANDFLPLSNANMGGRTAGDATVRPVVGTAVGPTIGTEVGPTVGSAVGSVAHNRPRKDSLQSSRT